MASFDQEYARRRIHPILQMLGAEELLEWIVWVTDRIGYLENIAGIDQNAAGSVLERIGALEDSLGPIPGQIQGLEDHMSEIDTSIGNLEAAEGQVLDLVTQQSANIADLNSQLAAGNVANATEIAQRLQADADRITAAVQAAQAPSQPAQPTDPGTGGDPGTTTPDPGTGTTTPDPTQSGTSDVTPSTVDTTGTAGDGSGVTDPNAPTA